MNNIFKQNYFAQILVILFIGIALIEEGCATPQIKPIDKMDFSDQLKFLIDGTTTREKVLLKLGEPSGRFETDRILTYLLTIDNNKKIRVLPRQLTVSRIDPREHELNPTVCSLVLVFQKENILEKSGLICSNDKPE